MLSWCGGLDEGIGWSGFEVRVEVEEKEEEKARIKAEVVMEVEK